MHYDNAPVGMGRASRRLHILQEPMSAGGAPAAASEGATGARPSSRWPEAEPAETAPPVDWSASGCSLLMAGGASNRALGRAFAAKPGPPKHPARPRPRPLAALIVAIAFLTLASVPGREAAGPSA